MRRVVHGNNVKIPICICEVYTRTQCHFIYAGLESEYAIAYHLNAAAKWLLQNERAYILIQC